MRTYRASDAGAVQLPNDQGTNVSRNTARSLAGLAFSLLLSSGALGASWNECNGTPVRPKYPPLSFAVNSCSINPDGSTNSGVAVLNALGEAGTYVPLAKFGNVTAATQCSITHGDGQSDMAYVPPGQIDGNLGLTLNPDRQLLLVLGRAAHY